MKNSPWIHPNQAPNAGIAFCVIPSAVLVLILGKRPFCNHTFLARLTLKRRGRDYTHKSQNKKTIATNLAQPAQTK
jgi:hypothetical protein